MTPAIENFYTRARGCGYLLGPPNRLPENRKKRPKFTEYDSGRGIRPWRQKMY